LENLYTNPQNYLANDDEIDPINVLTKLKSKLFPDV